MKKHLRIGLAVATLGYLCMQDALFVQDAAKATEKIDWEKYPGFREVAEKGPSKLDKAVFLRNASEIELPFSEKQTTKWDEFVNKINDDINKFTSKTEKMKEELNQVRDKKRELELMISKKKDENERKTEEEEQKVATMEDKEQTILKEVRTKATEDEINSLKQEFLDANNQSLSMAIEFELYRISLVKNNDEFLNLIKKSGDLDFEEASIEGKERILIESFQKEYKAAVSQLYEIYNQIKE